MTKLTLESPVFSDGEGIPRKYGYKNENVNPPLKINGIPSNTQSLVIIMDDPDAKAAVGKLWVHWVIWNIDPNTSEIAESFSSSNVVQGKNDFGENSYGGPAPPDKKHTYVFKLYALDTKLDLSSKSEKKQVESVMEGHILDNSILKGTYEP